MLFLSTIEKLQHSEDESDKEEKTVSGAGEGEASDDHRGSFEDAKYEIQTSSSGANIFLPL